MSASRWVCFQIGAREHYAIPRALHRRGLLKTLVTDAWVRPGNPVHHLPGKSFRKLSDRFDSQLDEARVRHFTVEAIAHEAALHFRSGKGAWDRIMERNDWFQQRAVQALEQIVEESRQAPNVFCYNYAAAKILRRARELGCRTVLCGIDPGPEEEDIVSFEQEAQPGLEPSWERAPAAYWENWREECSLADVIMVNSSWSKKAFTVRGVDAAKIDVIPLIYQSQTALNSRVKVYPREFTAERPLRVLFLGSLILRKGLARIFEAIRQLRDDRFAFYFVGHDVVTPPKDILADPRVHWVGPVPRSETGEYYEKADVFLFPTLSDGFGLTQLEAQAYSLPLLVSDRCGDVAVHGETGLVVDEPVADQIAQKLLWCASNPEQLREFSRRSGEQDERFSEAAVVKQLLSAVAKIEIPLLKTGTHE